MSATTQPPVQTSNHRFDVQDFLARRAAAVNLALDRFLPSAAAKPATIHRAMRYSLFAGGKRLRPALCLAAAAACGGKQAEAMPLACAVECIHTYSLVHDDLPAMDNDDYRRGKLTKHKNFCEGIAGVGGGAPPAHAIWIARCWQRWASPSRSSTIFWMSPKPARISARLRAKTPGPGKPLIRRLLVWRSPDALPKS